MTVPTLNNTDCDRIDQLIDPLVRSMREVSQNTSIDHQACFDAIDTVTKGFRAMTSEQDAMADDLLYAYEQLGIVFDVTRRLLSLRTETDVMSLIVERMRATYDDADFRILSGGTNGDGNLAEQPSIPDWLDQSVDRAKESRRVSVAHNGDVVGVQTDGQDLHSEESIIAPVFSGNEWAYILIVTRRYNESGVQPWKSADMLLLDSLMSFCGDAIRNFRLLQKMRQMSMDTVLTLVNAVDQKDPYTSGHSNRVGYYSMLLGKELGLSADEMQALRWSALLHDVGKIGIRDEVLKKSGKLTEEEFDHIKEHPVRGYNVVRENPHMREALDGVLFHHERYDGKGYPQGLEGENIPLQARIIQIADIFDALTTTRSYRNAFSWQKALSILEEEAGSVVDPTLSRTFVQLMKQLEAANPSAFCDIGKPDVSPCLTSDEPSSKEDESTCSQV
jgi:HD-GYP domain-containing protein (c-di-GMP phosphodiesterase class II)